MTTGTQFWTPLHDEAAGGDGVEELRQEVREFLAEQRRNGSFTPRCDAWLGGFSPDFSRALGARGWIGMTWPARYGGNERSSLERFVVIEELLAAGAPVAAHWFADRQSGPALLRFGTEEQRRRYLPEICSGQLYFAIGMSEPDSGSDLASVRTRAVREPGGWQVTGTKIWTSNAHGSHEMITLCRTSNVGDGDPKRGLSQLIVNLGAEGVAIRPIALLTGEHHFNEVVLDGVFVPDERVLGEIGSGWVQVTAELAHERSGPERFLSTLPLLIELTRVATEMADERLAAGIGRLVAELRTLRALSLGVAAALNAGTAPVAGAALVKDLGTRFERSVIELARLTGIEPSLEHAPSFASLFGDALLHSPGFTLRGGTNEILRGIVARELGLR